MMQPIASRVQKHRDILRSHGLRPVQLWIPDSRRKGFVEECRRQSLSLTSDAHETETLDWIESASDYEEWV